MARAATLRLRLRGARLACTVECVVAASGLSLVLLARGVASGGIALRLARTLLLLALLRLACGGIPRPARRSLRTGTIRGRGTVGAARIGAAGPRVAFGARRPCFGAACHVARTCACFGVGARRRVDAAPFHRRARLLALSRA